MELHLIVLVVSSSFGPCWSVCVFASAHMCACLGPDLTWATATEYTGLFLPSSEWSLLPLWSMAEVIDYGSFNSANGLFILQEPGLMAQRLLRHRQSAPPVIRLRSLAEGSLSRRWGDTALSWIPHRAISDTWPHMTWEQHSHTPSLDGSPRSSQHASSFPRCRQASCELDVPSSDPPLRSL